MHVYSDRGDCRKPTRRRPGSDTAPFYHVKEMGRFDWDNDIVSLYCFVNRAFEGENLDEAWMMASFLVIKSSKGSGQSVHDEDRSETLESCFSWSFTSISASDVRRDYSGVVCPA